MTTEFDAASALVSLCASPRANNSSCSPSPSFNNYLRTPSLDSLPTPPPLFLEESMPLQSPPFKIQSSPSSNRNNSHISLPSSSSCTAPFSAISKSRFFSPPTKGHLRATKAQLVVLEAIFEETPAPSAAMHGAISDRIGMQLNAVRNWFQNRRAKERKVKLVGEKQQQQQKMQGGAVTAVIPQISSVVVSSAPILVRAPLIPSSPTFTPLIRKPTPANVMSISALI
ncbi:hypothetical protein BDR26DRAFT_1003252 [Obelidium mucronatum]|nr:hypothetical protein BDR26DRAFT_1003252 [Obelidium mucronatum]